jgi:predicted amino acid dehydrogenase
VAIGGTIVPTERRISVQTEDEDLAGHNWVGASALKKWQANCRERQQKPRLDVVLLTHPRDEQDVPRLFSWASNLTTAERRELVACCKPTFGEIIRFGDTTVGILFLPAFASEMMDPASRHICRTLVMQDALSLVSELGGRLICLGGLTGALTNYGRRLVDKSHEYGIEITTGHAATAISIVRLLHRALQDLDLRPERQSVVVLGVGSVGGAVADAVSRGSLAPRSLVLVDTPQRQARLREFAAELTASTGLPVAIELTSARGELAASSACHSSSVVISAVSSPYVLDIAKVREGTILIDDSQPFCWSRHDAWRRVRERGDIVPCDAGLVQCSSIGFRSFFPFDFAGDDTNVNGIAWSCLAEGLLKHLNPQLPATVGEPDRSIVAQYSEAFTGASFSIPPLQCGPHVLPLEKLRASMSVGEGRAI